MSVDIETSGGVQWCLTLERGHSILPSILSGERKGKKRASLLKFHPQEIEAAAEEVTNRTARFCVIVSNKL